MSRSTVSTLKLRQLTKRRQKLKDEYENRDYLNHHEKFVL